MTRKLTIAFMIIVIALGAAFTYKYTHRPIYIGFGAGLSGQWSQLGVQVRNGFLQAVDEINENDGVNGRKIVPVIFDDKNDNEYAKTIVEDLKERNIDYFVGFAISAMTPSIETFMENSEVLVISPTMSTNLLTGRDDNFFRVCNASANEAYTFLKILSNEAYRDFAIVYDISNRQYTGPTHDIIIDKHETNGLDLIYDEAFDSHKVDFEQLAARIHSSRARNVIILASGVDTAEIAQQLKLKGSTAQLYANAWATTQDLLVNGGKAVENMRVIGLYDISSNTSAYLAFEEAMIRRYGNKPTFPQIFGYESVRLLKEAMETADSMDVASVKKAIVGIGSFEGLQQTIEIDKYGDVKRGNFIYEVKNGAFTSLKK